MIRRLSRRCSRPATNTAIVHQHHIYYFRICSLLFRYILAPPITSPCLSTSPVRINYNTTEAPPEPVRGLSHCQLLPARCRPADTCPSLRTSHCISHRPPYPTYNLYTHTYTSRASDCHVSSQFCERYGTRSFQYACFFGITNEVCDPM